MISFLFPKSSVLRQIAPELIQDLQRPRPTYRIFPVRDYQAWRLDWQQRDGYRGFQQLRGLNGQPSYVRPAGYRRFSQEPAVTGEYREIDEMEMTTRATVLPEGTPVNVTDLVRDTQDLLNVREVDFIEWTHWAMLLNGTFTLKGPLGAIYAASFPIQTATFSDWSDLENGTPYADLLALDALALGKSVSYGLGAEYWMNSQQLQYALLNRNPLDFGGMRAGALVQTIRTGSPATLRDFNEALTGAGLGTLNSYNQGYNRESDGAFVRWLPTGVVSIWGQRSNNDSIGEYRMVRNINNPANAPGRYTKVIDTLEREVPRKIYVHQGHNGGVVLFYPSAIIRANAGA
jgi:hypothetical protein